MSEEERWMNDSSRLVEGRRLRDLSECLPRSFGVFKSSKLTLTCLDAGDELVAIGCNAGLVFIYEKSSKRTGMLPTEGKSNSVTSVKLCELIQGVAYGCISGVLVICELQIQAEDRKASLKMVRLDKDHSSAITCLSWHKNGNFLVSGDAQGKISITTVNFIRNVHVIRKLSQADSPIVQLSAGVAEDWIVVSTSTKSFLLASDRCSGKQLTPIGEKERKSGSFGACLWSSDQKVLVYVARPGLRLWKASLQGKVLATLQYRGLLSSGQSPAIQMDSVGLIRDQKCSDGQFHTLHLFAGKYIVTHCENNLWVLDPDNNTVLGCHGNLGKILDVAATMTEIFVLREATECPILTIQFYATRLSHVRRHTKQKAMDLVEEATTCATDSSTSLNENTTDKITPTDQSFIVDIEQLSDDCNVTHQHQQLAADHRLPSQVTTIETSQGGKMKVAIVDDEEMHEGVVVEKNHDIFHDQARNLEKFQHVADLPYSDEIVYRHKEEKRKKKDQRKKKIDSVSALPHNTETNETRMAFADPDTLMVPDVIDAASFSPDTLLQSDACQQLLEVEKDTTVATTSHSDKDALPLLLNTGSSESSESRQSTLLVGKVSSSSNTDNKNLDEGMNCDRYAADSQRDNSISDSKRFENVMDVNCHETMGTKSVNDSRISLTIRTDIVDVNKANVELDDDKEGCCDVCDGHSYEFIGKPSLLDFIDKTTSASLTYQVEGTNSRSDSCCGETCWPTEGQTSHAIEEISEIMDGSTANSNSHDDNERQCKDRVSTSEGEQASYDMTTNANVSISNQYKTIYDKFTWEESMSVSNNQHGNEDEKGHSTSGEQNHSSLSLSSHNAMSSSLSASAASVEQLPIDEWLSYCLPNKKKIKCMTLSNTCVFVVDDVGDSFMAEVGKTKLKWAKISGEPKMSLLSVSPNQLHILGVTSKNCLYVRLGVSGKYDVGDKWSEISSDILYVAVENNQMWGLRRDGTAVYSAVIPVTTRQKLQWDCLEDAEGKTLSLVQVTAGKGVVWARDKGGSVYYRDGISLTQPQGTKWSAVVGGIEMIHICVGGHQTCWSIHHDGSLLFMKGVNVGNLSGESLWWMVGTPDCSEEGLSSGVLFSLLKPDEHVSKFKVVAANDTGVCICAESINFHWSNSALLGNRYETINLQRLPQSASQWLYVAAGSLSSPESGLVWTLRHNGEILCFSPTGQPFLVDPPSSAKLTLLTVSETAVWGLVGDIVLLRDGINLKCPEGVSWKRADTKRSIRSPFRWLSCGRCTVWAVDKVGRVWLREASNQTAQSDPCLRWVNIGIAHRPFKRVAVASDDSKVWAIDIEGSVYVRKGISEKWLSGKNWECVSGPKVEQLVVGKTSVWAISTTDKLLCKFGVTQSKYSGDDWKKVVGPRFSQISVTPFDQLWGINKNGQIFTRHTTLYSPVTSPSGCTL